MVRRCTASVESKLYFGLSWQQGRGVFTSSSSDLVSSVAVATSPFSLVTMLTAFTWYRPALQGHAGQSHAGQVYESRRVNAGLRIHDRPS